MHLERTLVVASWGLSWICFDLVPAGLHHVKETRDVPKEPQFLCHWHCHFQHFNQCTAFLYFPCPSYHLRIVSRIVSAHWERRLFGGNSLELGSLATLRRQEPHRWSAHVKHQCYRCCDSSNSSNSSIISSFQFISSIVPSVCLQSLVIVCMMPMCYFNNWKHPELMTCFTHNQKRFPTLGLARILPRCRDAMLWKAMLPWRYDNMMTVYDVLWYLILTCWMFSWLININLTIIQYYSYLVKEFGISHPHMTVLTSVNLSNLLVFSRGSGSGEVTLHIHCCLAMCSPSRMPCRMPSTWTDGLSAANRMFVESGSGGTRRIPGVLKSHLQSVSWSHTITQHYRACSARANSSRRWCAFQRHLWHQYWQKNAMWEHNINIKLL